MTVLQSFSTAITTATGQGSSGFFNHRLQTRISHRITNRDITASAEISAVHTYKVDTTRMRGSILEDPHSQDGGLLLRHSAFGNRTQKLEKSEKEEKSLHRKASCLV
ncbi:hypothetical protein PVAND_004779 [Polypedilum vanderplanki]|uniref:Uncharacterized protein n=1 Tax=Polypedilum vanderplanki TaxID=319348 RepID=A0A9J6BYL5_POLVA|nr:hypothetical protein PVAND_004779 [Polypedilum vanderplanki]